MKKRPRSRLTALQAGLSDILGEEKLEILAGIARLRRAWPAMVGPVLAQHTEPVNIESGMLLIAIDHPVMAQQIRFLQCEIRDACFQKCHVCNIRRIRTRMQPGAGMSNKVRSVIPARSVGMSEKKRVADTLRYISDKTLRHAMFDARMTQLSYMVEENKW